MKGPDAPMRAKRPVSPRTATVAVTLAALISTAALIAALAPEADAAPGAVAAPLNAATPLPLPAVIGPGSLISETLNVEGPLINNIVVPGLTGPK
ncbi:hypothetical protein ACFXAZ_07625 [Streptomyces sp. NPDC059477]|uniref:hypothetical protein n=1 Tax=Streptomyces sp. NPDC059477 TaxID=3346847 RepID=UPI00367B1E39